jgi:serine/threonine-protein kinase
MIGTRLAHYEITVHLGSGGMGDVYQATDSKLGRSVAVKFLPEAFARSSDRVARFEREARVLASLNHPNIAVIHGLEDVSGKKFLVMELVPGETLADLIQRGPIPVDESLNIAKQIAEALEAAHESGVIHRDLKPANVKITPEGRVKVLDFGLAKAFENDVLNSTSSSSPILSNSPTIVSMPSAGSLPGMILGTAAYMSPEQARGKTVDKRADIWAFGVVLVEMLTGQRVFNGEETSDVLAAVLRQDIDLSSLPAATPPRLRHLLKRCLDRDAKQRLRDIGEARVEIARMEGGLADELDGGTRAATEPVTGPGWRRVFPWALVAGAAAALVAMLAIWAPWRTLPTPGSVRLTVRIGSGIALRSGGPNMPIALSPDGTTLAFTGRADADVDGRSRIFVRRLDQLQPTALVGTEDAQSSFFSPNGQWLAFFTPDKLKKVPVSGGAVVTLCDTRNHRGGTWTDDDTIVFSANTGADGLMRVPAAGGTVTALGTLSPGILTQRWPHALPGKAGILYTEHRDITDFDSANLVVAPAAGGASKIVVRGGSDGQYLPSGHLIYLRQGKLVAVRFDLARLEVLGQPVPVVEDVIADSATGLAQVAISSVAGTVAYMPGEGRGQQRPIDWMTRDSQTSTLRATASDWENPNFSPDGQKLAMDISDGKQRDVFVYEWTNNRLTQLTFDPSNESAPVWSPDGKRITFASDRGSPGIANLYSVKADGTGGLERLTDSPANQRPGSWDPAGKFLVFEETEPTGSPSVKILPINGDLTTGLKPGAPTTFVDFGPSLRRGTTPEFSPDGRWIAYRGEDGIYVRPFPGPGGQWKISPDIFPRWSATGSQLLYATGNRIFVVAYSVAGDEFRAGSPELWSTTPYQMLNFKESPYAVHPDGKRLAISAVRKVAEASGEFVFILNFLDELRRALPASQH